MCSSAFVTSGKLTGKRIKLKEITLEDGEESMEKDKVFTHDRKCNE